MAPPPLHLGLSLPSGPESEPAGAPLLKGYVRGVGWTYLSLLLTGGSTFFLAVWSIRRVGSAQYGLFALVTSLAALLAIFDYALGLTVQRAGARTASRAGGPPDDDDRAVVHAAHGAYVALGVIGAALTVAIAAAVAMLGLRTSLNCCLC